MLEMARLVIGQHELDRNESKYYSKVYLRWNGIYDPSSEGQGIHQEDER